MDGEPRTTRLFVCMCVESWLSWWGVVAFQKKNVMEPAFWSLQLRWEDELDVMTVMRDGLGAVTFQIKRA